MHACSVSQPWTNAQAQFIIDLEEELCRHVAAIRSGYRSRSHSDLLFTSTIFRSWRCWGLESMIVAQHFSRHKNVPTTRRARPFTCWSCISGPLLWLSTKSVQKAVQVPFTLTEAHLGNYWGRMLAFFRKQISFFFVWIPGICVVIFSATVLG